jgi:hypothetical protein
LDQLVLLFLFRGRALPDGLRKNGIIAARSTAIKDSTHLAPGLWRVHDNATRMEYPSRSAAR